MKIEEKDLVEIEEEDEEEQGKTKMRKLKLWNTQERRKYLFFICANKRKFQQQSINQATYAKMASYINSKGKGFNQCYYFHDIMKHKFKSLQNIIKQTQNKYGISDEEIHFETQKIKKAKQALRQKLDKLFSKYTETFKIIDKQIFPKQEQTYEKTKIFTGLQSVIQENSQENQVCQILGQKKPDRNAANIKINVHPGISDLNDFL